MRGWVALLLLVLLLPGCSDKPGAAVEEDDGRATRESMLPVNPRRDQESVQLMDAPIALLGTVEPVVASFDVTIPNNTASVFFIHRPPSQNPPANQVVVAGTVVFDVTGCGQHSFGPRVYNNNLQEDVCVEPDAGAQTFSVTLDRGSLDGELELWARVD